MFTAEVKYQSLNAQEKRVTAIVFTRPSSYYVKLASVCRILASDFNEKKCK